MDCMYCIYESNELFISNFAPRLSIMGPFQKLRYFVECMDYQVQYLRELGSIITSFVQQSILTVQVLFWKKILYRLELLERLGFIPRKINNKNVYNPKSW